MGILAVTGVGVEELQQCGTRQLLDFHHVMLRFEIRLHSCGFLRAYPDKLVVPQDGGRRIQGILLDVVGCTCRMLTPRCMPRRIGLDHTLP
ncbi:hypothetical protein A5713_05830 [Mycobacterium sp. E2497]|nr:hypothetical protein A5713_05830 [Mycobacterium sp. E2497]